MATPIYFAPGPNEQTDQLGRRLRVLISAFACNPRGATGGEDVLGWHVVEYVAGYHETWVITGSYNRPWIEEALAQRPRPSLHVEYLNLPAPWRWLQGFQGGIQCYAYLWQIAAYRVARRLHRRHVFDLFHHVTYANDWMASFTGALLPVPYVRGPGGGAHRVPPPFLSEFSLTGRVWEHWRSIGQWLFRHDPFFVRGQQRAQAILVCTQEALQAVEPRWRQKAHLCPVNGISAEDLHRLSPSPGAVGVGKFLVLSAGKLLRLKNFPVALQAFQRLAEAYADVEYEVIGDGPDRPVLERMVHRLGLNGRVRLTPWMPRRQFLETLQTCDVFLFPSLRDGGGAVVIEAMAAGKPVVCLGLGGPGLHVTDECGIKVPASTPERVVRDLAAALEQLYVNEPLRRRMGGAGRRRLEEEYRWDRLAGRLLAIYAQAVGYPAAPAQGAQVEDEVARVAAE